MDIQRLRTINLKNRKAADYAIDAAKKEIEVASMFPLNLMGNLRKATEMDLTMSEKIKDTYDKESEAIDLDQLEEFERQADRRLSIFKAKERAAQHLTELSKLNEIHEQIRMLGKKSRNPSAGWHKMAPGRRERTVMRKKCGSKCFLGPGISFPVCAKGTCRVNPKGVHAAYSRAREWGHSSVAKRARKMMKSKK
jgi:hypothetical protein